MKFCSKLLFVSLIVTVCATNAWAGYADVIMDDNPVAYYTFDGLTETSTTVPNVMSTTNEHDGNIIGGCTTGATPATALIGGSSMEFDGSTGFVQLTGTFGGSAQVTVEAWVKLDTLESTWQAYVQSADLSFVHGTLTTPGTFNGGVFFTESSYTYTNVEGSEAISTDQWYHLVITGDSTDRQNKMYLNGTLVGSGSQTSSSPSISTVTDRLLIGAGFGTDLSTPTAARALNGMIDEVAIYNKALTGEQIAEHYAAATEVPEPSTLILLIGGLLCLLTRRVGSKKA